MPTDPSSSRTRPLVTRRRFLKWSGAAGVAAAGGAYWSIGPTVRRTRAAAPADTPLKHVVISMQENRSFDHYFGYAPWIGAYGPPAGYTQPDGSGGTVAPYHFESLETPDIPHDWDSVHDQWDGGAMDGFYTNAGHLGARLLPGARYPVLLQPPRRLDAARSTTSARCWGRPGRIASITWPGRRAGSRPTACGATASSTTR